MIFSRARTELEQESRQFSGKKSQMTATGRKKAKADTIARLNALWVPTAPRIILVGSRISATEAE